jgi:outer membrane protein assembly factor BamB
MKRAIRSAGLSVGATLVVLTVAPLAWCAESVGWRTDGSGSYPKAQPPLEWSAEKNVIWKTQMPGASNSIPVLLGHRIFICAEPCTLLCLHRDDGRILWQKSSSYDELEIAPDVRAQLKIERAEAEQLAKRQADVDRESSALRRKLKEDPAAKAEIDRKLEALRLQSEALKAQRQKLTLAVRYSEPGKEGTAGFSTPTPVTNGQEVFVAFGNGLVACFDLDGNRRWLKLIEHSTAAYAHGNSPVLVGDKLLIHFADLVALRTKDGSECWRLKRAPAYGTPLAVRIGAVDCVVTPHGLLVRVEDGTVLAERLGSCGANSPVLNEGCVYFIRNAASAVRLPDAVTPPLKVETLWQERVTGSGYWFSSPVLHDGLLYAANDQGILSVLEAATGKLVYVQRLDLGGTNYPSLSLAGGRVYISSDRGATVVLQPGREYRELARNQLEPFRSSLVFEGKRLYVRTLKYLYCIGE